MNPPPADHEDGKTLVRLVSKSRGRNKMRFYKLEVQFRWLVLAAFIWACSSGCAMLQKSPQKAEQSRETKKVRAVGVASNSNQNLPFFHQVRWQGETLSMIAKWYTGDWRNWKALAEVNPWLEPNNLFTGLKVKIPRQLLKNQKDMPREFVLSFASQNKASAETKEANEKEVSGSSAGAGEAKGTGIQFVGP
jgi:iron uptake system EfeUOB component EfeO/EfeM